MNARHSYDLISFFIFSIKSPQILQAGVFLTFHCVCSEVVRSAVATAAGTFEPEISNFIRRLRSLGGLVTVVVTESDGGSRWC